MKYLTCQFSPLANHSLRRIVSSNRLRIYVCETLVTWVPKSSPPVRPLGLKTQPGWSKHLTREKYIKRKDPFLGTLRLLYSWSRPRNLLSRTRRWSGVERAKKKYKKNTMPFGTYTPHRSFSLFRLWFTKKPEVRWWSQYENNETRGDHTHVYSRPLPLDRGFISPALPASREYDTTIRFSTQSLSIDWIKEGGKV